jgi:hypothetical protein
MINHSTRNIEVHISFFSISIGWIVMNLIYSVYLVLILGKASDTGSIMLWSALFVYISWVVFIIYPLKKIRHIKILNKPFLFTLISVIYAKVVFIILVGGLFRTLNIILMFMPLAILVGLFFGLTYSMLINNIILVKMFNKRKIITPLFYLSPIIILFYFLWVIPTLFPYSSYNFMPNEIQEKIFIETILKFKAGNSFEELRHKFPNTFSNNHTFSSHYRTKFVDYDIDVKNDTIIKLNVTVHK